MRSPLVLVVDDLFGRSVRERANLCKAYRLRDVTEDVSALDSLVACEPNANGYVAEAVFCSGQREVAGGIQNSVDVVLETVRLFWEPSSNRRWALCLLDLRFVSGARGSDGSLDGQEGDDNFGFVVLGQLQRQFPELPVVILSSRERSEVIQACRQLGACDFIQRHTNSPVPADVTLSQKLNDYGLLQDSGGEIIGNSLALLQALAAARRAATGSGNILLLGESGTGKELFARYIHRHSPVAAGPYRVFDAFGTAESLHEDVLFGHERGAYTGAQRDRKGIFEESNGGTLFIDEIADIPSSLQNRLLRPIEARTTTRLGSSRELPISFQLILATNKDLDEHTRLGLFKSDLLNRINAYSIWLPPLRERKEDISMLAMAILQQLCMGNKLRWPRQIDDRAVRRLTQHEWLDGNVRELRSVLERAIKDNPDSEILVETDLQFSESGSLASEVSRGPATATDLALSPTLQAAIADEPDTYDSLFGSWLPLQREAARHFVTRLVAALRVTARRDADSGSARPNLAGAVGCLVGRKVSTVEAADFVKRVVRFQPQVVESLAISIPLLGEAIEQAKKARGSTITPPRVGKARET